MLIMVLFVQRRAIITYVGGNSSKTISKLAPKTPNLCVDVWNHMAHHLNFTQENQQTIDGKVLNTYYLTT